MHAFLTECKVQDVQLQHQLQSLESRLHSLTGDDKAAVEDELVQCTQLIDQLYRKPQYSTQSSSTPEAQSTGTGLEAISSGSPIQPAAVNVSSQSSAPLLLGPPS